MPTDREDNKDSLMFKLRNPDAADFYTLRGRLDKQDQARDGTVNFNQLKKVGARWARSLFCALRRHRCLASGPQEVEHEEFSVARCTGRSHVQSWRNLVHTRTLSSPGAVCGLHGCAGSSRGG
jgi:hypothetical protein